MLKSFFLFFLISLSFESYSQEKVLWSYHYDETNEELVLDAQIADGWHIYSQVINEGIGPIPTSFTYFENSDVKLIGKTIEPESIREYDENFEGELNFFKDKVEFVQELKFSKSTIKEFCDYRPMSENAQIREDFEQMYKDDPNIFYLRMALENHLGQRMVLRG